MHGPPVDVKAAVGMSCVSAWCMWWGNNTGEEREKQADKHNEESLH